MLTETGGVNTNKKDKVFHHVAAIDEIDKYQAEFQLPDDGCPESEQFLRVSIRVDNECQGAEATLSLLTQNKEKEKVLGYADCDFRYISELLYKSAHIVIQQSIEPV